MPAPPIRAWFEDPILDAIVLTCDKYRALTEHMVFQYDRLWPDHRFRFLIPFQHDRGPDSRKCKFVRTDPSIRQTVLTLLRDFDDEDWVYWAIDDKYPIMLDVPKIKTLERWLETQQSINGVLFCRCRKLNKQKYLNSIIIHDQESNKYLGRNGYEQIWLHQLIRVKILRRLFQAFPEVINCPKDMDALKKLPNVPVADLLFVRDDTLAIFGESTHRGVLTSNCSESILKYKLRLPMWFQQTTCTRIILGEEEFWRSQNRSLAWFARARAALSGGTWLRQALTGASDA
jgi:hypothetical protein